MTFASADLFNDAILPGLSATEDVITPDEEAKLIEGIDGQALFPFRFQGWLGKRLTTSFGWHYDFDSSRFGRTDPIPDWLLPLKGRAAAFAGVGEDDLVKLC